MLGLRLGVEIGSGRMGASRHRSLTYGDGPLALLVRGSRSRSTWLEADEPRYAQVHALAAERNTLRVEQCTLASPLCERAVGTYDSMPRHGLISARGEHRARGSRRTRRAVAVGAYESRRDCGYAFKDALSLRALKAHAVHDGREYLAQ